MCGICGKLYFDRDTRVHPDAIKRMCDVMYHRGPDDEGIYISGPVGLGHRRLSIIDLNTGRQPIANEDESIWIVFNGEIYNYQELRRILIGKGHTFTACCPNALQADIGSGSNGCHHSDHPVKKGLSYTRVQ